jgi:hypothetical protein
VNVPSSSVAEDTSPRNTHVTPPTHPVSEQAILFAAFGLLAFGVLALGAVQEWAICVLECGAGLLFAMWAGYQIALERIRLSTYALIPALILLSLPSLQLATGRTAYFYATRYQLLQWIACGGFYLAASEFSGSSVARRRLAIGVTVFGTLYAIFAIIQGFIAPPDLLYGIVKTHGTGFGSYTNRNHYAGLMEMLMPFGLVISTVEFLQFADAGLNLCFWLPRRHVGCCHSPHCLCLPLLAP